MGTQLLSSGFLCAQGFVCALQESVSPVLWKSCNQILLGLQSQIPWGFSVPLQDIQVGKSVSGPRTFLTVKNFFGIIVLQFVGHLLSSSVVGLMATSFKRTYATCCVTQVCCSQPESLSPQQTTADPCLHRRYSNTQRQLWLSLCEVSGSWCTQDSVWAFWASLAGMEFDSKCYVILVGM